MLEELIIANEGNTIINKGGTSLVIRSSSSVAAMSEQLTQKCYLSLPCKIINYLFHSEPIRRQHSHHVDTIVFRNKHQLGTELTAVMKKSST